MQEKFGENPEKKHGLEIIEEMKDALEKNDDEISKLKVKILSIFLRQPNQIGTDRYNLRNINLRNEDDFTIFIRSVERSFKNLKEQDPKINFKNKEELNDFFDKLREIMSDDVE